MSKLYFAAKVWTIMQFCITNTLIKKIKTVKGTIQLFLSINFFQNCKINIRLNIWLLVNFHVWRNNLESEWNYERYHLSNPKKEIKLLTIYYEYYTTPPLWYYLTNSMYLDYTCEWNLICKLDLKSISAEDLPRWDSAIIIVTLYCLLTSAPAVCQRGNCQ